MPHLPDDGNTSMITKEFLKKNQADIVFAGIIILSAFLNLWNIWNQGISNDYYAAAVKSMLENPNLIFFNSLDAAGFVTVDKPPVGLWVQVASAALFGYSGWALVLPQALAGVGSVVLIYFIVSRPFGKAVGLISAFALAITPILVAVSRNGTMDSQLIFIILLAIWAALRAAREKSLPFLLVAAILVGIGFNIKMIQAFIVVPAIFAIYFLGADISLKKRASHLGIAAIVLIGVSLSWAVAVDMVPADQRPYIGGSGDNTVLGLIVNYNGIHRLENGMGTMGGGPQGFTGTSDRGTLNQTRPSSTDGAPSGFINGYSPGDPGDTAGGTDSAGSGLAPRSGFGPQPESGADMTSGDQNRSASLPAQPSVDFQGYANGNRLDASSTFPDALGQQPGLSGRLQPGPGSTGRTGGGMMDDAGSPGIFRLFGEGLAGQISWLLPLAIVGIFAWWRRPVSISLAGFRDAGFFSEKGLTLMAMGLWLSAGLIYFSFTTGFWHTYYLATMAPPLAALAGIGIVGMYQEYNSRKYSGWLLVIAVLVTGLIQAYILSYDAEWSGLLIPLVLAGTISTAVMLALLRIRNTDTKNLSKSIATLALVLLFIAPFVWACTPVAYGGGGILPVAGPQLARNNGGMGNAPGFTGSDTKISEIARYLLSHNTGETYLAAVPSSNSGGADLIIETGRPVMVLGGFSGSDQILSTDSLSDLIRNGTVRYFYLSSGGGGMGNSEITSWVSDHCSAVSDSTLNSGITTGSSGQDTWIRMGAGGSSGASLYDCAGYRNQTSV